MSNRAVSSTYRAIIDDVIANVRQDFEDMGIENEVLVELQRSWEAKTVTSGVADFEGAPPGTSAEEIRAARKASREEAAALKLAEEAKNNPKPEAESSNKKPKTSGTSKSDSATSSNANGGGENLGPGFINPSNLLNNATASSSAIDGNSNSNSISSLLNNDNNGAETSAAGAAEKDGNGNGAGEKRKREENNQSDEIGSDLDDDDDEGEENLADVEGEDIGLCLYDKVQRVKNKWKCVLRDGIASVDGRDYLFSKCNGEFEW